MPLSFPAFILASRRTELEEEKVAVVSVYPGIVKTEKMNSLMTKNPAEFEANVSDPTCGGRAPLSRILLQSCRTSYRTGPETRKVKIGPYYSWPRSNTGYYIEFSVESTAELCCS